MIPKFTINLLRTLFVIFTIYIGWTVSDAIFTASWIGIPAGWVGVFAGAILGLVIILVDSLLKGISLRVFSSATFGLLMGTIFAKLLLASNVLREAPEEIQWVASLVTYATCAYFGMMLAMRSNRDEFSLIIPYVRFRQATVQDAPLLIDSNIIIDGRITEICRTGFLSSSLVVPRFILHELQRIADSSDSLKRERGRKALERLQQMQLDPALAVTIHEQFRGGFRNSSSWPSCFPRGC